MNYTAKLILLGLASYAIRFAVGGVLYKVATLNPMGFAYGLSLTLTAFLVSLIFLRYGMKPATRRAAFSMVVSWMVIALVLDVATAQPIIGVTPLFLLGELQTWTRLLAIGAAAHFAVR